MGNAESVSTTRSIYNKNNGSQQRRSVKSTSSSSKSKKSSLDELNSETTDFFIFQVSTVVDNIQAGLVGGIRELEEQDHPGAALLDSMCGPYQDSNNAYKGKHLGASYSDEFYISEEDDDDSLAVSEEETTVTTDSRNQHSRRKNTSYNGPMLPVPRYVSNNCNSSEAIANYKTLRARNTCRTNRLRGESSFEETDDDIAASEITTSASIDEDNAVLLSSKLKSSFHYKGNATSTAATEYTSAALVSKRCFFTKNKIGHRTQHYEGLTLTGNVIFMLASAMKLKCCPTICDEDLRRVEQKYPSQFSKLPPELLLSCGWRRTSKYCCFSNKPIPDGLPFFHSRQRLHPSGGYFFLLASAVGMLCPLDVEPLNCDTLVLLETDYPTQCDLVPSILLQDPNEWTMVDKFCFFSGGPINTDEDVYYTADLDGNLIYMLAFLSPSLTASELYKLDGNEPLRSIAAVEEVESVYDLTERDFEDLKLYHLGPYRALPQYILQPMAWTKTLPPHYQAARATALIRAREYEEEHGIVSSTPRRLHLHELKQQHSRTQETCVKDNPTFDSNNHRAQYESLMAATNNMMRHDDAAALQQQHNQTKFVQSNNKVQSVSIVHHAMGSESSTHNDRSREFLNDRIQYCPIKSGNGRYQNIGGQQRRYSRRCDSYNPDSCQPCTDHTLDEQVYEYDAGKKKYCDNVFDETTPHFQQYKCKQCVDNAYNVDIIHQCEDMTPQPSGVPRDPNDDTSYEDVKFTEKKGPRNASQTGFEYDAPTSTNGDGFTNDSLNDSIRSDKNRKAPPVATRKAKGNGGVNHIFIANNVKSQLQNSSSMCQTNESEYNETKRLGGSSIWKENENNPNRSSRRALILQIARARMKNQSDGVTKQLKSHLLR